MEVEEVKLSDIAGVRLQSKRKISIIVIILLAVILGGAYLAMEWNRYQGMFQGEAIKSAESLGTLLTTNHIKDLSHIDRNNESLQYIMVKNKLIKLVEKAQLIHYAYLLGNRDGEIVVLVDSNTDEAPIYYSLDNFMEELEDSDWIPFESTYSTLTKPIENKNGVWIRALVPIQDAGNGEIIAIFGLSYSAKDWRTNIWRRMSLDMIVVISMIILIITLTYLWRKNEELAFQEALYRNIFQQAPIGIILQGSKNSNTKAKYVSINPMAETILGRGIRDLADITWPEFSHSEDLDLELPLFEQFVKGEIDTYSLEKRLIKPDGQTVWTNVKISDFSGSPLYGSMYLCLLEDISARKHWEEALKESERSKSVLISHLPGMAYRCKNDRDWTMEFVSDGCEALTGYAPNDLIENSVVSFNQIISPEYRDMIWDDWVRTLHQKKSYSHEYEIVTRFGQRKWVMELGQGVYEDDGSIKALEGIILDISEQKRKEHQIAYLKDHDFLTGLYNRSRIDMEKKRLDTPEHWPLSVVICDIDGLRMINGAYGHVEGDRLVIKTANLIQSCRRMYDVVGRISGGEFVLFLPHTDNEGAKQLVNEIQEAVDGFNRAEKDALYKISLSIGHSTKYAEGQCIEETIKTAEEYLRSKKLLNQNSLHSAIVSSIMATLYAKSQETEEHGQRLGRFCQMIGERLGLDQKSLDDLQLLSKIHDIGKIGIDDSILNKPDRLTFEEWEEMKRHPEIGYNIAISTPQLEHIAEYILSHHERWDGSGYPSGLSGTDIPLISRILSVADAYDAMTEDRVYRKALTMENALRELERNGGTQFDPEIVELFIQMMKERPSIDFYEPMSE
ncbi:MAG: HD domain-containing phosphohydrolase [Anaerovoracaceae bacterium]